MVRKFLRTVSLIVLSIFLMNCISVDVSVFGKSKSTKSSGEVSLNVENATTRYAKFSWTYPEEMSFFIGDYINLIVFDSEIGENGSTPIYSVAHKQDDVDLSSITSFEAKSLQPGIDYTAKFELVTLNGDIYTSETSFTTNKFEIKDIQIKDIEEDILYKKTVSIDWKVSDPDIEFQDGDKIQIYMKKISDDSFPKTPSYETKDKVTTAELSLPNFEDIYDFKICYLLGGNKIESEVFWLESLAKGVDFKVEEVQMNSAKFVWSFLDEEILNDNSELHIFLKEEKFVDFLKEPIIKAKGKEELLKTKEYLATNLKFKTTYNIKVQFIVDVIDELGKTIPIKKENEYKFETKDFKVKDLKVGEPAKEGEASNNKDNEITISWDYEGESISFSENDFIKISIKEVGTENYSESFTITQKSDESKNLAGIKNAKLTLPKYNTKYNIKFYMSIGGKEIFKYISHKIQLPEITFGVKVEDSTAGVQTRDDNFPRTSSKKVQFKLELPENLNLNNGDKVEIFWKKSTEESYPENNKVEKIQNGTELNNASVIDVPISSANSLATITEQQQSQDPPKDNYDFKVRVTKDNSVIQEILYIVDINNSENPQIVRTSYNKKTEKQVEARAEYAPYDYDPNGTPINFEVTSEEKQDSRNISQKSIIKKSKNKEVIIDKSKTVSSNTDGASGYTVTNLDNYKKKELDLEKFEKYKITFKYEETKQQSAGGGAASSPPAVSTYKTKLRQVNVFSKKQIFKLNKTSVSADSSTSGVDDENVGSGSSSDTKITATKEDTYDNKFDVFSFELVDVVQNKINLDFGFESYYNLQSGDKIEVFLKKVGDAEKPSAEDSNSSKSSREENSTGDLIATFEQGKDGLKINEMGVIELVGLDYETKYKFTAKFTAQAYKSNPIQKEVDLTTPLIDIKDMTIEHLSDITGIIRWKNGENFMFNPNDVMKIFYKEENGKYPEEANETIEEIYLQQDAFVFVDKIDTNYDVKVVFELGDKKFEKELKMSTTVDDINAEVVKTYPTSGLIKWNYPQNYLITTGETISIFVKESTENDYSEEPMYFMEHDEEEGLYLQDFKSVLITELMPNTSYNVKIVLDLYDIGKKLKEIELKTEDLSISELKFSTIKPFEFDMEWKLSSNDVDFIEENSSIKVYMKNSEESWSEDNLLYTFIDNLNQINSACFLVEDVTLAYDIKVDYVIGDKSISKEMSAGVINLGFEDNGDGSVNLLLAYPPEISFEKNDEIQVFVCNQGESDYKKEFSKKQDLSSLTNILLKNISYFSKVGVIIKSKQMKVFPLGIIYSVPEGEALEVEIVSELVGNWIDIALPEEYNLDTTSEVRNSIGGESYYDSLDDGTEVIVIDKIVPGKHYENVLLVTQDVDGNEVRLSIGEFTLEPSTLLEEFLRNSYFFAFDREPDEGGYNYWKQELEENENMSGKYFLINLMFAEKEFSNRNLSDEDLIKVLYQIVVNREYDAQGLSYWIAIYNQYLQKFNGDKYEAKKTVVLRMVYEPEFGRLCEQMGINW